MVGLMHPGLRFLNAGYSHYGSECKHRKMAIFCGFIMYSCYLPELCAHNGRMFGVKLVVMNSAVGGRDPNPYSLCLSPMLGDDSDVVMREWEFWPWGAGFDQEMVTKQGQDFEAASIEIFLRTAFFLTKQPAVHLLKLNHDGRPHVNDYLRGMMLQGKPLSGYNSGFVINAFDAFGKPFDKLRAKAAPFKTRWKRDEKDKEHCDQQSSRNVADCPVDYDKQDGYHSQAQYLGYDVHAHPQLQKYDNHNLFVNWHPAPLGHEVIGNQVAYYHLQLMRQAVSMILGAKNSEDELIDNLQALASPSNMPPNVACSDVVCGTRSHCAYSYLPKAQGPDVGDWMLNDTDIDTHDPWTNEVVDHQMACDEKMRQHCDAPWKDALSSSQGCYDTLKKCSYRDQKRGFKGTAQSKPVRFRFTNLWHCQILIGEPNYEWAKPFTLAQWEKEIKISINGEHCSKENCVFYKHGYVNSVMINVRAALGGKCRREPVIVEISLQPLKTDEISQLNVCQTKKDKCEVSGRLFDQYSQDLCVKQEDKCSVNPLRTSKVHTFISEIIAF